MISTVFKIIRPFRKKFILLTGYSLILNIFTFSNPVILKFVFDEGVMKKNLSLFLILVSSFVGISILWRVLNFHYSLALEKFKMDASRFWIRKTMDSFLNFPYQEVLSHDAGYFLSRIYDEPDMLANELIGSAIDFVNLILGLIIAFALLVYFSFYATLILLLVVPFTYWLSSRYSEKIKVFTKKEREREAEFRETTTNIIESFRMIKTFDMTNFALERFVKKLKDFINAYLKNFRLATLYETLSSIFMSISELSVIIVSGYLIILGKMTFGSFMGFMNTFWGFLGAVERLLSLIPTFSSGAAIYDRISEFVDRQGFLSVKTGDSLILKNISFGYKDSKVLKNFSIVIKNGEKVLLTGENGSGKTTLACIMAGLLKPEGDTILFSKVSFMPEKFLNLKLQEYRSIDERYIFDELIEKFNLKDLVDRYPDELSAGQKKKFAILLTLIRDAALYIFDEPLANIDDLSKNLVMDLIFEYTKDKSVVVISHNFRELSRKFDKIINLRRW